MFINSINDNTTKIILSNLSKIPPCPGIKLEKSFIFKSWLVFANSDEVEG